MGSLFDVHRYPLLFLVHDGRKLKVFIDRARNSFILWMHLPGGDSFHSCLAKKMSKMWNLLGPLRPKRYGATKTVAWGQVLYKKKSRFLHLFAVFEPLSSKASPSKSDLPKGSA